MQNSKMKHPDSTPSRTETRGIRTQNRFKTIVTSALLLAATSATAGIVFLPAGGQYTNPELAPVNIQRLDENIIRVHTTGLTGELIATTERVVLTFDQAVIFDVDYADGIVSGRSIAKFSDASSPYLTFTAEVRGQATCLPFNGHECGQLAMDLELQGVLTDPNDPSKVGQLRMEILGSLIVDSMDFGVWAAMSANATIGANEGLVNYFFEFSPHIEDY